jgi:ribosome-associated heat shock protein Hsp15
MSDDVRIDKWLWVVRLYKTRNLASEACRGGKVKIGGQSVKPSREIKLGDIIDLQWNSINRRVQVKKLATNRVGAALVEQLMTDLTPKEEFERLELLRQFKAENRPRGTGRPTKKERRDIDRIKDTKS